MFGWRNSRDLPLLGPPSALGLVLGAALFALSLTPSLIPRTGILQGVLGGLCFAIGYLAGHTLVALYRWVLEREPPSSRQVRRTLRLALPLAAALAGWGLWNVTGWQNGIHAAMGIPPVESARPFTILAVAAVVAGVLIFLGRLFRRLWRVIAAQLERLLPRRLALAAGLLLAFLLFWSIGNDMMLRRALAGLDEAYAAIDALVSTDQPAPTDPLKSGSPASLASWDGLGAEGRNWVLSSPDAAGIAAVTQAAAVEPLRIYVGLNNAPTAEARAKLALDEALRVGAFDRAVLVVATPTGTGWMDPAGMQPLDYLTGGDVATIGVQYSYLPSWMSLLLQPDYGSESAEAVFHAIYGHWRSLPPETRPRLFLFGLSPGPATASSPPPRPRLWGIRCRARFGSVRPLRQVAGGRFWPGAIPKARPGCRASAMARSCG
ncbi:hypothetical protein MASR1M32_41500 [Rhodobacter sp.]